MNDDEREIWTCESRGYVLTARREKGDGMYKVYNFVIDRGSRQVACGSVDALEEVQRALWNLFDEIDEAKRVLARLGIETSE